MKRREVFYKGKDGKLKKSRQVKRFVETDVLEGIMSHVPVHIDDAVSKMETLDIRFVTQSLWNAINWSQSDSGRLEENWILHEDGD